MKDCYRRVTKIMEGLVTEWEIDKKTAKRSSCTDPYYYIETYSNLFPPIAKRDFMLKCEVGGWDYSVFMTHIDGLGRVVMSSSAEFFKCENEYRKRPWDAYLNVDKHIQEWAIKVFEANNEKRRKLLSENVGLAYFISLHGSKIMGLPLMGFGYLPFVFPYPASKYDQKAFVRKI